MYVCGGVCMCVWGCIGFFDSFLFFVFVSFFLLKVNIPLPVSKSPLDLDSDHLFKSLSLIRGPRRTHLQLSPSIWKPLPERSSMKICQKQEKR